MEGWLRRVAAALAAIRSSPLPLICALQIMLQAAQPALSSSLFPLWPRNHACMAGGQCTYRGRMLAVAAR